MTVDELLISTDEAGEMLGVSGQTVRRYVRDRLLTAITLPSGVIRVYKSDVLAWLSGKLRAPTATTATTPTPSE